VFFLLSFVEKEISRKDEKVTDYYRLLGYFESPSTRRCEHRLCG
jgi:hypothetical protein